MSTETVVSTLAGILGGGVVGAVTSWIFQRIGARDAAKALALILKSDQQSLNVLAGGLHQAGLGQCSYDRDGNVTGFQITIRPAGIAGTSAVGNPTVTLGPAPVYDRQDDQPGEG